jgi:hypothetical protein
MNSRLGVCNSLDTVIDCNVIIWQNTKHKSGTWAVLRVVHGSEDSLDYVIILSLLSIDKANGGRWRTWDESTSIDTRSGKEVPKLHHCALEISLAELIPTPIGMEVDVGPRPEIAARVEFDV